MAVQARRDEERGVVVVGAGIVGASIAYHLAGRGVRVTVVDGAAPGSGASSHSFAWINAGAKGPSYYHDFNRRSMEMWDRFALGLGVDVGLRWGGKVSWEATTERARLLEEWVQRAQRWGYPTRLVGPRELADLEPSLSTGPVVAAELSPIDGQVEPQRVVDACMLRLRERGASILPGARVSALSSVRGEKGVRRVESLVTPLGEVPCDVVVLAAGTGTTDLASTAGVDVPQQVSPGVVVRTSPVPRLMHKLQVVYAPPLDSAQDEVHFRQTSDGSVQIGEGTQESLRRDDSKCHADDLLARAVCYLPGLSGAMADPVPVGYRPMPLDGYPVLGFAPSVPNLYVAVTHSGVTLAPVIGELAAMEIVDGARVEILDHYRPERFA
ncbi:MAG: FAD-binding oxidoreductase [Dehalococcoidia bacterium]|nr:FAD-binding oxidoreductase [Dehalococcoidia bacterium]